MTSGTDHKFSPSPLVFTLLCIGAVLPALLLAYAIGLTWPGACRLAMLGDGWQWWSGSYLARYGQIGTLFHPELMAAWHGPTGCAGHTWSYPPSMLVLVLPLAALSPLASIALFDGLGILGFAWAIRLAGIKGRLWFAMMFSPVVIYNLVANQNGAWFGTFLVAGLALSETSPVFGGILLGLLSVKPQLCVLLPAYLLGRRNWRCIAGAGLTALALVVVSIFLFSWQSWVLFVSAVIPAQQAVLSVATMQHGSFMFITIYALAHWAGLSAGWSNIIQLGCSVLVMLVVFFMARQERIEVAVKWALLAILGVLATPYMQRYDMFGVTFACGLLFQRCAADKPDFVIRGALALLWVIPGLMPWLALLQLPPLVPLLAVLVVGAWLMGEMRKQDPAPGALKVV
jgi:hypothetical protein